MSAYQPEGHLFETVIDFLVYVVIYNRTYF